MAVVSKEQTQQAPNPELTVVEESTNLRTCHQCRQKRTDVVGSCVTKKRNKGCPIKYCTKCLKNRYGQNAEEVALKDDWTCPKCIGNCNCSLCMKKRGQRPTGILVHTAKATGFNNVSELLKTEGSDKFFYKKKVKLEAVVELGQDNSIGEQHVDDGRGDENAAADERSVKRIKVSGSVDETKVAKKVLPAEKKNKKTAAKDEKGNSVAGKTMVARVAEKALAAEEKNKNTAIKDNKGNSIGGKTMVAKVADKVLAAGEKNKKTAGEDIKERTVAPIMAAKLPKGSSSITVSGIDVPPENAGNVFQFLEFCSTFGKALDLRKGQPECVIRELLCGRSTRRQQHSNFTQMIIQLLTVILEDRGQTSVCLSATDYSWFTVLGECFSESEVKLDCFPPEVFQKGIAEYEKFDSSKRLKLLNFLCDETLGTSVMRNCIDNQNHRAIERKKEAREKINAAKEKEKQLKQKLQDELAKAVTEKNGIPLSFQERDAILSRISAETKEVHSEMQKALDIKNSQECEDALRPNSVRLDDNGLIFWNLKSCNEEQNILLQDLGSWSEVCPHEKWFIFSSEQKPEIDKYISYIRMKRLLSKKKENTIPEALCE